MESERNYRLLYATVMIVALAVLYFTICRDHNGIDKACSQIPTCEAKYDAK